MTRILTQNKDLFVFIKVVIGTIIACVLGCICIGIHECGKIVLDKIKK